MRLSGESIQDDLHCMRYIIDRIVKVTAMSGAPINLDQSKASDKIDHRYLEVVLRDIGFCSVFRI